MLDVIKSYLVSLGFQVDENAFNKAQQSMKNMDKTVGTFSSGAIKNFAVAGTAVASFFVAAEIGIAKYVSGLAKADLRNEMFARRMWMSKGNAVAYKNSLSALGAELQDLYLSPELLEKFQRLRSQAYQMAPPAEYYEQMHKIREITFEFQRMKLEITYAAQWVGYYLFKYLEKPITDIKKKLKDFNDKMTIEMPHWTKQVAQVISWFVRLGETGVWGIKKLLGALNELSPKTKVAGSALLGFFALLKMGPIGWLIAGITALLLLMDDFKTYKEGGDSLFGNEWEKLEELKQSMEDDGTFKDFKDTLDDIAGSLGDILKDCGDITNQISKNLGFDSFADMLEKGVLTTLHKLDDVLSSISGFLQTIDGILTGDTDKMKAGLEKLVSGVGSATSGETTGNYAFNALGDALNGNTAGVKTEAERALVSKTFDTVFPEISAVRSSGNFLKFIADLFTKHADGGIQYTPHLGWVADDGPEAIIPLSQNRRNNALKLLTQTAGLIGAPVTNTSTSTVMNIKVENSPQYKIYGTEANSTAKAVSRQSISDYGILIRNFKGAFN
jgi:hypothetical protein